VRIAASAIVDRIRDGAVAFVLNALQGNKLAGRADAVRVELKRDDFKSVHSLSS
jgi:hypothetical protein